MLKVCLALLVTFSSLSQSYASDKNEIFEINALPSENHSKFSDIIITFKDENCSDKKYFEVESDNSELLRNKYDFVGNNKARINVLFKSLQKHWKEKQKGTYVPQNSFVDILMSVKEPAEFKLVLNNTGECNQFLLILKAIALRDDYSKEVKETINSLYDSEYIKNLFASIIQLRKKGPSFFSAYFDVTHIDFSNNQLFGFNGTGLEKLKVLNLKNNWGTIAPINISNRCQTYL